ncbi:YpsA SLOG family protein [Corynebacterium variabile]|uniref:YpsA SLOG family protein n=1 Tax=Corynebacterium variabile TaxID=1727 RepID=UPI003FD1F7AA
MNSLIATIRSGGQTGVDRGALDAARAVGVPIEGWCPAGGSAGGPRSAHGLPGTAGDAFTGAGTAHGVECAGQ